MDVIVRWDMTFGSSNIGKGTHIIPNYPQLKSDWATNCTMGKKRVQSPKFLYIHLIIISINSRADYRDHNVLLISDTVLLNNNLSIIITVKDHRLVLRNYRFRSQSARSLLVTYK